MPDNFFYGESIYIYSLLLWYLVYHEEWNLLKSKYTLVSRDGLGTRNLYVEGLEIFSVLATFFGSIDDFSLETLKNHQICPKICDNKNEKKIHKPRSFRFTTK